MIFIKKGKMPKVIETRVIEIKKSDEWKAAENKEDALLRGFFDQLDKQQIRENLVAEQHGLCAYCMKRIEPSEKMNIEHYIPIKGHKESVLDFNNMLGCCKGGSDVYESKHKVLCCDAAKKDQRITIDPRSAIMMSKIRYNKSGKIYVYPHDDVLQNDIDIILGLNGELNKDGSIAKDTSTGVVMGRREVYRSYELFIKKLYDKYKGNTSKISLCIKKKISEIEGSNQYPEFAGVLLYFLKRKLNVI